MYGWNDKPNKAEPKGEVNGEPTFGVGWRYLVTVHTDGSVTYRDKHRHTADPRATFPNMDISDGEIRIPVTDLVATILMRLDPVELATALWTHDDVKSAFMDCLVSRYNDTGVDDDDRRRFLAGIKEAIHSVALDALRSNMAKLEYDTARKTFFYHEVNRINEMLREREIRDSDGNYLQISHEDRDPDFRISGKHWNDARDWWRAKVLERFPAPEVPAPPSSDLPWE